MIMAKQYALDLILLLLFSFSFRINTTYSLKPVQIIKVLKGTPFEIE